MGLAYCIRRILMGGTIEGEVYRVINKEETDPEVIAEVKRWVKNGPPVREVYSNYSDKAFERVQKAYDDARRHFKIKNKEKT